MDSPSPLFEQLLRQVGKTRRLARSLLGDESAAEDAIQETWASASRRALPETPEPWLRTALRNRLLNQAREDRRRTAREEKSQPGAAPDSPEELLARLEMHKRLVEAVARLAEPYRQTVLLRYFDELSSAEIGERLGVPAATVRGRLKTAVDLLREDLDRAPGGRKAWMGAVVLLAGGGRLGGHAIGAVAGAAGQGSSLVVKLVVALTVAGGAGSAVVVTTSRPSPQPAARVAPLPPARFERLATDEPPATPPRSAAHPAVVPATPVAATAAPTATAATVAGEFSLAGWAQLGEPHAQAGPIDTSRDRSCPPMRDEEVRVARDGSLANVVVRVVGGTAVPPAPPPAPLVIEQRDCQYHPRIAVARAGQLVQLRSADQVAHQARATAGSQPVAAAALAMGTPPVEFAAPRPGETVRLGCDEHPWMTATVVGADSPWYAVTDGRGRFAITLPAGTYDVEAWHERYGSQWTRVTVGPGKPVGVLDFVFGKEWQPPTGVTSGRGWPVGGGSDKCAIAIKDDSVVARACREGGIKKAKAVMKAMVKKGKQSGLKLECNDCHKDDTAGNWALEDGAEKRFKELLARQ